MSSSSSADAGRVDGEDEDGGDVLDAFAAFHQQLYAPLVESESESEEPLPPAFMGDSVRLARPPDFRRWQSTFRYLQVSGSALLPASSGDHISLVPTDPARRAASDAQLPAEPSRLVVSGVNCATIPTERHETPEEIFAADGVMEEIVVLDERGDDDDDERLSGDSRAADCPSLRSSRMHEVVDALTFECFSTAAVPLMTSFFQALLQKQQAMLCAQRGEVAAAAQRAAAARVAAEQVERRRREQQAIEEAQRAAAIAQAAALEAAREAERLELLRRQQREENDDEEIRIRTLAYSHAREWSQLHKKSFAHRGRQLTYLKPVLPVRDEDGASSAGKLGVPTARRAPAHKAPNGTQQLQVQRRPAKSSPRTKRIHLPLIGGLSAAAAAAAAEGRTSFSRRNPDASDEEDASAMVHSSRPANVYTASPYRIPASKRATREASAFTSSID